MHCRIDVNWHQSYNAPFSNRNVYTLMVSTSAALSTDERRETSVGNELELAPAREMAWCWWTTRHHTSRYHIFDHNLAAICFPSTSGREKRERQSELWICAITVNTTSSGCFYHFHSPQSKQNVHHSNPNSKEETTTVSPSKNNGCHLLNE